MPGFSQKTGLFVTIRLMFMDQAEIEVKSGKGGLGYLGAKRV